MAAVRDNLCELGRLEIPRPKCQGMQFIATRGKQGFYRTLRANGAAQYGVQLKPQGPRRPKLSNDLFQRPETLKEENTETDPSRVTVPKTTPSLSQTTSVSPQPPAVPMEMPPDYPEDYVPRHLRQPAQQRF